MKTKSLTRKPQLSSRKKAGITADNSPVKDEFTFPTFTPFFDKKVSDKTVLSEIFNIKILRKDDKNRFLFLKGVNRDPDHVSSQMAAVRKLGILRPVIVANYKFNGKQGLHIIDGQNLYLALTKLGYDVPYMEIKIKDDNDLIKAMALVNTSAKAWTLRDYIQAWAHTRKDYSTLLKFMGTYNLETMAIASILFGYNGLSTQIGKMIRDGMFKVQDEVFSRKILVFAEDVLDKAPKLDRHATRVFTNAYLNYVTQYFNRYRHNEFLNYLAKNWKMLTEANNKSTEVIDKFFQKLSK